ncbi:MAG: hypothetical protein WDZ47_00600 [Bacteroidales bacterium]
MTFRAVWLPGTDIKIGDILILKDGALVSIGNIGNEGIPFNKENSYFLKTSKLSGKGMVSALGIASRIAKLANWDFQRNYVVHQVYHAEDFVFLGSAAKDGSVTFKGSGEAVRNFIEAGSSAELARTGSQGLSIEVTDKAGGAVVMRLFRIKRNGEIY